MVLFRRNNLQVSEAKRGRNQIIFDKWYTMSLIEQYLSPNLIAFLDVTTRDDAIIKLVDLAYQSKAIKDKQAFFDAVISRETIVTTGIGMGVAIPHAKMTTLDKFFIVVGILSKGVDWKALDGAPVRLIFLIGGPDDRQTEYLNVLSSLTTCLKDEERRKKLLQVTTKEAALALFCQG